MKKVVILGASGKLGSHLCIHYAKCGWNVIAVTGNPGIVTQALSKYAQIRMCASDVQNNMMQMADLVIDCSKSSSAYPHSDYKNTRERVPILSPNAIMLSSTLMHCEGFEVSPELYGSQLEETIKREREALSLNKPNGEPVTRVLRLPFITSEGHELSQIDPQFLMRTHRCDVENNIRCMNLLTHPTAINEHENCVRDYVPVHRLPALIEAAMKYDLSYVDSGNHMTSKEWYHEFIKDPRNGVAAHVAERITFDNTKKPTYHCQKVDYLPNVWGEQS